MKCYTKTLTELHVDYKIPLPRDEIAAFWHEFYIKVVQNQERNRPVIIDLKQEDTEYHWRELIPAARVITYNTLPSIIYEFIEAHSTIKDGNKVDAIAYDISKSFHDVFTIRVRIRR